MAVCKHRVHSPDGMEPGVRMDEYPDCSERVTRTNKALEIANRFTLQPPSGEGFFSQHELSRRHGQYASLLNTSCRLGSQGRGPSRLPPNSLQPMPLTCCPARTARLFLDRKTPTYCTSCAAAGAAAGAAGAAAAPPPPGSGAVRFSTARTLAPFTFRWPVACLPTPGLCPFLRGILTRCAEGGHPCGGPGSDRDPIPNGPV
jgi:hypothetical protein